MQRVGIFAPRGMLRQTLVHIADAGCVEIEPTDDQGRDDHDREPGAPGPADRRPGEPGTEPVRPALCAELPDVAALQRLGRADLLAGEAQLTRRLDSAVRRGSVAALAGWCPASKVAPLARRLTRLGSTLVPLPAPRGIDPPTLLRSTGTAHRSFTPLVRTYGTVSYADLDPTMPAGAVYVLMFGVMFGDAGHGALLLLTALLLYLKRPRRLAPLRFMWPFVAGAGVTSTAAGIAYGEFFGPSGVLPVLWLNPLEEPVALLVGAVGLGVVLLALAYAAGTVNRWREGGPAHALYAVSGIAGTALFLGLAAIGCGVYLHQPLWLLLGGITAFGGLVLAGSGLFAATAGGAGGAVQAGVQLVDATIRMGTNAVSFARLAAFGLTHAALGAIVWDGTTALARAGPVAALAAGAVFVVGNALAFALEALTAGVQALRLEFYELFSRVFEAPGRPFRPWHVPTQHTEVAP
jgi:V/A-type H+-transporting ATPase subunit I